MSDSLLCTGLLIIANTSFISCQTIGTLIINHYLGITTIYLFFRHPSPFFPIPFFIFILFNYYLINDNSFSKKNNQEINYAIQVSYQRLALLGRIPGAHSWASLIFDMFTIELWVCVNLFLNGNLFWMSIALHTLPTYPLEGGRIGCAEQSPTHSIVTKLSHYTPM